jgi:hypothetical protein
MRWCKLCQRYTRNDDCGIFGQPHGRIQFAPNGNRIVKGSELSPELHRELFPDALEYMETKTSLVSRLRQLNNDPTADLVELKS